MIGVGENNRSAQLFERFLRQPFDRGRRAHGHERRRLDHTVRCAELAATRGRPRVLLPYFKRKTHPLSVSGENPPAAYPAVLLARPSDHPNFALGNSGTAASNSRVYACTGRCRICSTAPVSTNFHARITATRVRTCATTGKLCEINMYVSPNSCCSSCSKSSTCAPTETSSADTGSRAPHSVGRR